MKNRFLFIIFSLLCFVSAATAEKRLWVYSNSGRLNSIGIDMAVFDSLSRVIPEGVTPEEGDDKLYVYASVKDGRSINASEVDSIVAVNPYVETVSDICGNTYNVVKIGNQYWMAENMCCDKYDTESERAGVVLSVGTSCVYTPYYYDARHKQGEYSGYLTEEQVSHFGFLYNWAAAVGLEHGRNESFTGRRQGICPNGWHVPTYDEFNTLATYLDGNQGYRGAGAKLKSVAGWYSDTEAYQVSFDNFAFTALPVGLYSYRGHVDIGIYSHFWTATSQKDDNANAHDRYVQNNVNSFHPLNAYGKIYGESVRCLKN